MIVLACIWIIQRNKNTLAHKHICLLATSNTLLPVYVSHCLGRMRCAHFHTIFSSTMHSQDNSIVFIISTQNEKKNSTPALTRHIHECTHTHQPMRKPTQSECNAVHLKNRYENRIKSILFWTARTHKSNNPLQTCNSVVGQVHIDADSFNIHGQFVWVVMDPLRYLCRPFNDELIHMHAPGMSMCGACMHQMWSKIIRIKIHKFIKFIDYKQKPTCN